MKLSVIVPAYNAEKTIRQSLDSILAQTRPVDELIVINDGSTDGTEKILQEYRDAIAAGDAKTLKQLLKDGRERKEAIDTEWKDK